MVIQIKKPVTKEKLEDALKAFQKKRIAPRKGNLSKFFGKNITGVDPIKAQKKLRDDWN
jgi:hypothetical protein